MMEKTATVNDNDVSNGNASPAMKNDEKIEPDNDESSKPAATDDIPENNDNDDVVDEKLTKLDQEAFLAAKRREIEENVKRALEERKLKEAKERKARLEAKGELWEETTYVHAVYKRLRKEGLSPAEAMAKSREEYEDEKTEGVELERRMEDLMKKKGPKKKGKKKKNRNKKGGKQKESNVKETDTMAEITEIVPLTEKEARLRAKKEIIAQRRQEREERRKNEMFSALFGL